MENKSLYNFNELSLEVQKRLIHTTGCSYEVLSEDADALYSKDGRLITYI